MSGDKETYLDHVYEVRTADETRELYNEWADSYEDEIKDSGYTRRGPPWRWPRPSAKSPPRCSTSAAGRGFLGLP